MLEYILDIFKYVGRVAKNTFLIPIIRMKYVLSRTLNIRLTLAAYVKKKIKDIQKFLMGKPKKIEDYVEFKRYYIAKSLLAVIIILCIVLPVLFYIFAVPFLVQKFGTATFIQTSSRVKDYSGKVKIVTEEKELIYKGELKDGKREGKGELYDNDGNLVYKGTFGNGLREGEGTEYFSDGGPLIKGVFKGDYADGVCTEYYENGKVKYEGEFALSQYNGAGKLYSQDGALVYEGQFQNGRYSGTGMQCDEKGKILYEGEFKDGVYNGYGKLYQKDGVLKYIGNFAMGKYSGSGILYDADSNIVYEGAFIDGSYHGAGKLYNKDKLVYEGDFVKGVYFGNGKLYSSDTGGLLYEGEFKNGEYSGKGILYNKAERVIYDGPFMDNEINYEYLLGLPADDVRSILGSAYDTDMFEDGYGLTSSDLSLSVFLNYNDIDVESRSLEVIVWGERKVFGVLPGATLESVKKDLGEPLEYGRQAVQPQDGHALGDGSASSLYAARYVIDNYSIWFYFRDEKDAWIYAIIAKAEEN